MSLRFPHVWPLTLNVVFLLKFSQNFSIYIISLMICPLYCVESPSIFQTKLNKPLNNSYFTINRRIILCTVSLPHSFHNNWTGVTWEVVWKIRDVNVEILFVEIGNCAGKNPRALGQHVRVDENLFLPYFAKYFIHWWGTMSIKFQGNDLGVTLRFLYMYSLLLVRCLMSIGHCRIG